MEPDTAHLLPYLLPVLILVMVVRRALRERRIKVERLWLMPVLLLAAGGLSLSSAPPTTMLGYAVVGGALALGAAAGWWRGRLTHITVNPETHELTSRTSPVGVILIAGLYLVRFGLRAYAEQNPGVVHGAATLFTDGLMLFAIGMLSVQRLEMWIRCQRLLTEARAGGPAAAP